MTRADPDNINLCLANGQRVELDDVYHVEWTKTGALLGGAAGVLTVDRATAADVERKISPGAPAGDAAVAALSRDERAAWLGAAGPAIRNSSRVARAVVCGLAAAPCLVGALLVGRFARVILLGLGVLLVRRTGRELAQPSLIDGDGVAWGARRLQWSELRGGYRYGGGVVEGEAGAGNGECWLATTRGRMQIDFGQLREATALATAIERCLEVRRQAAEPFGRPRGEWLASCDTPGEGLWCHDGAIDEVLTDGTTPLACEDLWRRPSGPAGTPVMSIYEHYGVSRQRHPQLAAMTLHNAGFDARPGVTVTPEDIEALLGVAPGGELIDPALVPDGFLELHWPLRLEGAGLLIGKERFAWAEVLNAQYVTKVSDNKQHTEYQVWRLTTTRFEKDYMAQKRNVDALFAAIQRVLLARDAGMELPAEQPLPNTALSLASEESEADERALSVSEK